MPRKPASIGATKADTITVRVNPKLKFGLEIAARRQRRSLSAVVERYIESGLENDEGLTANETLSALVATLWDPDEVDRFLNMAIFCPSLLTFEEERMWKAISENQLFWHLGSAFDLARMSGGHAQRAAVKANVVREHWSLIKQIGAGKKPVDAIPAA